MKLLFLPLAIAALALGACASHKCCKQTACDAKTIKAPAKVK